MMNFTKHNKQTCVDTVRIWCAGDLTLISMSGQNGQMNHELNEQIKVYMHFFLQFQSVKAIWQFYHSCWNIIAGARLLIKGPRFKSGH